MRSIESGGIQFINLSYPGDARSGELQRRANSHAARVAHAKARRLCTIQYQASKTSQAPEDVQELEKRRTPPRSTERPTFNTIEIAEPSLPSPVNLLDSDRKDPFQSFARSLQPVEHFLLDHYVRAVIPYMDIHCNKSRDSGPFVKFMTKEWVRLTLTNIGCLNGILLAACRHLLKSRPQQQQYYAQLMIEYKLYCVRALREAISSEMSSLISDSSVAIVMLLAYDELQLGDLTTSRHHVQGMIRMVQHNGGPQTLGSNGFLERLVYKYAGAVELANPDKLLSRSRNGLS